MTISWTFCYKTFEKFHGKKKIGSHNTTVLYPNLCYNNKMCYKGTASWLQIVFKIGGPKWPMEQKMMGHFLIWWAQAYQTNHSWHLGIILYVHTETCTCMHVCIDCCKTCLEHQLKKEDQVSLNPGQKYCRMLQGEHSAILATLIKLPFVIKIFVLSFLVAA